MIDGREELDGGSRKVGAYRGGQASARSLCRPTQDGACTDETGNKQLSAMTQRRRGSTF